MSMISAYNLYLGGYLPKVSPKTNVHNRRELKNRYKSIVTMNNAQPLSIVRLTGDTQAYALDVKEMSMELGEAAKEALSSGDGTEEKLGDMAELFDRLLSRSDQFAEACGNPSRPGGELRALAEQHRGELEKAGFTVDDQGYLSISDPEDLQVPEAFVSELADKCDNMSMNPMAYVEKKVYSYAHLYRSDIGSAYAPSMYSGMLFNSYC